MKLEMLGGPPWSAHGEYEPGIDPPLKPCPFCASTDLLCENTHTAHFNVECVTCQAGGPIASYADDINKRTSKKKAVYLFRVAFYGAIQLWNEATRSRKERAR